MADVLVPARATYASDFHAWLTEQAALLRAGRVDALDRENAAEEIESLGQRHRAELESRLGVLVLHLLKWQAQPERRGASWRRSIEVQRERLARLLQAKPSLRPLLPDSLAFAFRVAVIEAEAETGLPRARFPSACPYSVDDALDPAFWPGPA